MGNCHIQEKNKEEIGKIEVLLDKTRISRGDTITGRLKLFLKKEYPGRQISVRVRGIESIKKGIEFAENEIFGDTILLVAVNQMKEGEHKFFFDYVVPDKLQSQFSSRVMSEQPQFAVSMVYQIKGILEPVELLQDEYDKIEGSTYFSLLAEVSQEGISSNSTGKLKNEHGEYGNVEIGLKSNKAAYDSCDSVTVNININNTDVTIPLETLTFNLIKEIQFNGKTKNQYIKHVRREFNGEPVKDIILSQDIKFERGELDQAATKSATFELPPNLQPSFQGKQFSCKYFFELYAHYVKGPTNFIDAKARLKLNIIPEKMRNIVDPIKKIAKANNNSMHKSKIKSDFYSSQLPFNSAKKEEAISLKQLDETVNHNPLSKSQYVSVDDQKEINIVV